ncbi:MAG: 3-dehydroquinate synthase [Treponema sp.]|jgi:3-dehydroquinate synthase|nr:3-dehydroquinate synthase [Treponema sp.]
MLFNFGEYSTKIIVDNEIPGIDRITAALNVDTGARILVVADEHTSPIADAVCGRSDLPRCLLKSGEDSKTWDSVCMILEGAQRAGLARDGILLGVGGGVIGDLSGFAASIYMRGCRLALVATTLLAMVDAALGGKTGFDLFGIKNLAGSFYPAEAVYMPLDCLAALPEREWKSGMAELIKTAILDGDDFLDELAEFAPCGFSDSGRLLEGVRMRECINRAAAYKGGIVSEDPKEHGRRALLNLGHTFGHALEASAGLGNISHGEAVAWGIVRSCELGYALGITPRSRAKKITELIASFGYRYVPEYPLSGGTDDFLRALERDKKKKNGKLTFIVPDKKSAVPVEITSEREMEIVTKIIKDSP